MGFMARVKKKSQQLKKIRAMVKEKEGQIYAAGVVAAESILENQLKDVMEKRGKLLEKIKAGEFDQEAAMLGRGLRKFCRENRKPKSDRFLRTNAGVWIELDRPDALVEHLGEGFVDSQDMGFVEVGFPEYVEQLRARITQKISKIQEKAFEAQKKQ